MKITILIVILVLIQVLNKCRQKRQYYMLKVYVALPICFYILLYLVIRLYSNCIISKQYTVIYKAHNLMPESNISYNKTTHTLKHTIKTINTKTKSKSESGSPTWFI